MSAYVYVLGTLTPKGYLTYVGWCLNLDRRLAQHNGLLSQGAKSTKGRQWQLLYAEVFPQRKAAMQREWHLKRDRALRRKIAQDCGLTP